MPRKATGQVVERQTASGAVWALRFRAGGQRRYQTLGRAEDDWDRARAEVELSNVLADVRRGIWKPPPAEPERPALEDPTFLEFASQWFDGRRAELRERTASKYQWLLASHLLPAFERVRLSEITAQRVDGYRQAKVREHEAKRRALAAAQAEPDPDKRKRLMRQARAMKGLAPGTVNESIKLLSQILDLAHEYELLDRNPAQGRRRRLKAPKGTRPWLDRADQFASLLDAAGELDREARRDHQHIPRRAIVATMLLGGLRVGELVELRWRHVDLANGRLRVGDGPDDTKTAAGHRHVRLRGGLRDELSAWRAGATRTDPDCRVFPSSTGNALTRENVLGRIVKPAVARANQHRARSGLAPLPARLTNHSLRHSFCSLLVALNESPMSVMREFGHTDPAFTLRVYAHWMHEGDAERQALRALIDGGESTAFGHSMGTSATSARVLQAVSQGPEPDSNRRPTP